MSRFIFFKVWRLLSTVCLNIVRKKNITLFHFQDLKRCPLKFFDSSYLLGTLFGEINRNAKKTRKVGRNFQVQKSFGQQLLFGGIATVMVRPSSDVFGAINSTLGILQKVSVHVNLIDGGLAARGRHIREQIFLSSLTPPSDHTHDFILKKTTHPELPCYTLQSFPAWFFHSTYCFVPLYGKLCETRQQICMRSSKRFFWILRGCVSKTHMIKDNLPNNVFALVILRPSAP